MNVTTGEGLLFILNLEVYGVLTTSSKSSRRKFQMCRDHQHRSCCFAADLLILTSDSGFYFLPLKWAGSSCSFVAFPKWAMMDFSPVEPSLPSHSWTFKAHAVWCPGADMLNVRWYLDGSWKALAESLPADLLPNKWLKSLLGCDGLIAKTFLYSNRCISVGLYWCRKAEESGSFKPFLTGLRTFLPRLPSWKLSLATGRVVHGSWETVVMEEKLGVLAI